MSEYERLCNTPSDINQHLPTLKMLAEKCDHITEFGVRSVVSTYAFLEAKPKKIISYDIVHNKNMDAAIRQALSQKVDLEFRIESTLKAEIEPTDLLFIDTLHQYEQLSAELKLHADKARKYIVFHDVISFAYADEPIYAHADTAIKAKQSVKKTQGLLPAIFDFLSTNKNWTVAQFNNFNNGLLVLSRG